jgi:hypothetical protein
LPAARTVGRRRGLDDRQWFLQGSIQGTADGVCSGSAGVAGVESGRVSGVNYARQIINCNYS